MCYKQVRTFASFLKSKKTMKPIWHWNIGRQDLPEYWILVDELLLWPKFSCTITMNKKTRKRCTFFFNCSLTQDSAGKSMSLSTNRTQGAAGTMKQQKVCKYTTAGKQNFVLNLTSRIPGCLWSQHTKLCQSPVCACVSVSALYLARAPVWLGHILVDYRVQMLLYLPCLCCD